MLLSGSNRTSFKKYCCTEIWAGKISARLQNALSFIPHTRLVIDRCALTAPRVGAPVFLSIALRGGEERRDWDRTEPHRASNECLLLHAANEYSSHSYVCQLTYWSWRSRFRPLQGFRTPIADCVFFKVSPYLSLCSCDRFPRLCFVYLRAARR